MTERRDAFELCDVVRITAGALTGCDAVVMQFWAGDRMYAEAKVVDEMITAIIPVADLSVVTPADEECRAIARARAQLMAEAEQDRATD